MADEKQSVSDIADPREGLPPATVALLGPCYSQGQLRLRDWTMNPENGEEGAIAILAGIAVCVLDRVAAVAIKEHAGDFGAFRSAVGLEGGAAELGRKYAQFIYKDATRGSMPLTWYAPIRNRLFDAISNVELEFWRNYSITSVENVQAEARLPRDIPRIAERRKSVVSPILILKGWSILTWSNEARVDYNTAADYLNGLTNPHRRTLVRLARALGLLASDLPS